MTFIAIAPIVAGAAYVVFGVARARSAPTAEQGRTWIMPAVLSVLFLGFSGWAVVAEGSTGFWSDHTASLWGNQIWFDLLLAAGISWYFLAPAARAEGMRLLPWFTLVILTGSIGLLAVLARVQYLRHVRVG